VKYGNYKKRFFIEKPEKMLPEYFRVARERMVVRESFWVMAQKQDPDRFSSPQGNGNWDCNFLREK
jgi:hypothetical protein